MLSFYTFLTKIRPFIIVPVLSIMLFVIAYFIHQKCRLIVQIQNVPLSTIFQVNLNKVKKNLQIQSVIYNFILVIAFWELSVNLLWGVGQIYQYDILYIAKNSAPKTMHLTNSCYTTDTILIGLFRDEPFVYWISSFVEILLNQFPPLLCLFLIVLRRLFLDLPYKRWIIRYSIFIFCRFSGLILLSCFIQTFYLAHLLYLPFLFVDFYIYITCCRSFYLLLKGRRDEARWHSTKLDYLNRSKVLNQFFYMQLFTIAAFILLIVDCLIDFSRVPIRVFITNPCLLDYISLGYFPSFSVSDSSKEISEVLITKYLYIIQLICVGIVEVMMLLSYIVVCVGIVVKLIIRKRKFDHINDWITHPLMERYRASLETMQIQRRPPFIQDIRTSVKY